MWLLRGHESRGSILCGYLGTMKVEGPSYVATEGP